MSLEQRIKKEATEIAKRNEKIEIAKQLKRNGVDERLIAGSTGLTMEEVEN